MEIKNKKTIICCVNSVSNIVEAESYAKEKNYKITKTNFDDFFKILTQEKEISGDFEEIIIDGYFISLLREKEMTEVNLPILRNTGSIIKICLSQKSERNQFQKDVNWFKRTIKKDVLESIF